MHSKNNKGFTLIELLVVVAIIGLLSSVVLVSLDSARAKARDAKRKQDIKQIQNALALYYDSNNGKYPDCSPWVKSTDNNWNNGGCLILALKPFIPSLPLDPKNIITASGPWYNNNYAYAYGVQIGLQDYDLVTQLEVKTDKSICQFRLWGFHYREPQNKGAVWCDSTWGFSPYLYADH